jgi:hypothetical protein
VSDIFDRQQRRENTWTPPLDRILENQKKLGEREARFNEQNGQSLGDYLDFIKLKEDKYNDRFMTNEVLLNLEIAQEHGLLDEDELYKQATSQGIARQYGIDPEYVRANLESFLLAEDIDPSKKVPRDWFNGFAARARKGANTTFISLGANELMKLERPGLRTQEEAKGAESLRNHLDGIAKLNETLEFGDESLAKNPVLRFLQDSVAGNFLESMPYSAYVMGAGAVGNAVFPGAGGKIGGFLAGAQLAIGQEYYQLTSLKDENGRPLLDREIARNVAMTIGPVLSLIETAIWDSAAHLGGAVGKAMGKETAASFTQRVAAKVLTSLHARGFLYRIAQSGLEGLFRTSGEGFEEFLQQITEEAGKNIALEMQKEKVLETFGGSPEEREAVIRQLQEAKTKPGDILHNALEAFKGGAAATLLSGLPETVINYHNGGVEVRKLDSIYSSVPSEEAAIKATDESPVFAGMTPEQKLKTQKEMYRNVRSKRDAEEARITEEYRKTRLYSGTDTGTDPVHRDKAGNLYAENIRHTDSGGVTTGVFQGGNPDKTENNFYWKLDYRMEGGKEVIEGLRIGEAYEGLKPEILQNFANDTGHEVVWEGETYTPVEGSAKAVHIGFDKRSTKNAGKRRGDPFSRNREGFGAPHGEGKTVL